MISYGAGNYSSHLGYDNVDRFEGEVKRLEEKWNFSLRTLIKFSYWHKKMKKALERKIFVGFLEKILIPRKLKIIAICLVNTNVQHMNFSM